MFNPAQRYIGLKGRAIILVEDRNKVYYCADASVEKYNCFVSAPHFLLCYINSISVGKLYVTPDPTTAIRPQDYGIWLTWNNDFLKHLYLTEIARYNGNNFER